MPVICERIWSPLLLFGWTPLLHTNVFAVHPVGLETDLSAGAVPDRDAAFPVGNWHIDNYTLLL